MSKRITKNQLLGEIGESASRTRFLNMGFQFDVRSRLEAGIDAIAEVMLDGSPLAKMIAVQVKATESGKYTAENENSFTYLLKPDDLEYWKTSNIPVIIVLYRKSDETFFWKEVLVGHAPEQRKLRFNKKIDILDKTSVDRLAALTVPKVGHGYYVPPLGGGEEAIINMLPISLPDEIFITSTPFSAQKAMSVLLENNDEPRFDWIIKGNTFWSFHDPRKSSCCDIIDIDQVESIETNLLAQHEDIAEQNSFSFLLRKTLQHQVRENLNWNKTHKLFYFRALLANQSRKFGYQSAKKKTEAEVVNVSEKKKEPGSVSFVRHHAFVPRFEKMLDQWYLIINPTYYFTLNGFIPHSYPEALLSGKKRLDNNASLRGQVIMWHRILTMNDKSEDDLFSKSSLSDEYLKFGLLPTIDLPTSVPEDAWGSQKQKEAGKDNQSEMEFNEI